MRVVWTGAVSTWTVNVLRNSGPRAEVGRVQLKLTEREAAVVNVWQAADEEPMVSSEVDQGEMHASQT